MRTRRFTVRHEDKENVEANMPEEEKRRRETETSFVRSVTVSG